jgi:hypothetical protein
MAKSPQVYYGANMDKIKMCNLGVKGRGVRVGILAVLLLVLPHIHFLPLRVPHVEGRTHNRIWWALPLTVALPKLEELGLLARLNCLQERD